MNFYSPKINHKTRDKILLSIFSILFLMTRLQLIYSYPFRITNDELYIGTVAREILMGLKMPLFDYLQDPYAGGTLISGIFAVPFFLVFGSSDGALKLVALTLSLGSLILVFVFLNKHFGLKTASFASLLFIFPPPHYAGSSVVTRGNHCESIFFSIVTTFIFFEIFFHEQKESSEEKNKTYIWLVILGAISAFSIFFAYIYIYSLLTCIFFWFLFDKIFFLKKHFIIFCVSLVSGLTPLIYYNSTHSFRGLDIIKLRATGVAGQHTLQTKLLKYLFYDIPFLFYFSYIKTPYLNIIIRVFCSLILFLSFLFLIIKNIKYLSLLKKIKIYPNEISKDIFFVANFIFFSLMYLLSSKETLPFNFEPSIYDSHRYITPLYYIFFIVIALFLSRLTDDKKIIIKILGYGTLVSLITLGFFSNISVSKFGKFNFFSLEGFSYEAQGLSVQKRFRNDLNKYKESAEKIDQDYKHYYYYALGREIGGRGLIFKKHFEKHEILQKKLSKIEPIDRSYYYEGIGYSISSNSVYNQWKPSIYRIENKLPPNIQSYAFLGMAKVLEKEAGINIDIIKIVDAIDIKHKKLFYPLMGGYILKKSKNIEEVIATVNGLKEYEKPGVCKGIGYLLFKFSDYDITKFNKLVKLFPESSKVFLCEGLGESIFFYEDYVISVGFTNQQLVHMIKEISDSIAGFNKDGFYKGLGRSVAEKYGFNFKNCSDFLKIIPPHYRAFCYEGVGSQIALRFGGDPESFNYIINKLPSDIKPLIQREADEEIKQVI